MKDNRSRRLAAVMFTDIVGYTALMQKDEKAAIALRAQHRKVFQSHHKVYNGEILQYFGDGTLSIFQSGVEAVKCAIAIQQELNIGEGVPLKIGLHIGDIVFDGTEIYGDGVNVASRIESMGIGGSILLSENLNVELKNHPKITTKSLGHYEFKNVTKPIEVYAVTHEEVNVPKRSQLKGKRKQPDRNIAVLPFLNLSPDKENEYFTDGMTEEIINALAKIKGLKVTSRSSSFFFKNKSLPIRKIGKKLNVSTVLEGSIRLSGNKMRITAQLIDVAEDFHFWSETFDRSIDNIFEVQDEISLIIADKLREHVGHFEIDDQLVVDPQISVDSYIRYLKGRYHLLKMTRQDIDKGISLLEDLLQDQPDFPQAYLGIHLGYTLLGTIGFIPAQEAFIKAKPYLDKAIELDENLPECQLQLAYMCFLQNWDLDCTYKHLNKSLEIRPTVEYYQSMASTLIAERKFDAAMNYIDTALQLDPISGINYHLKGYIYYSQENFEKAIEWYKKSVSLESSATVSILYLGFAILLSGRTKEGLAYFQNLPEDEKGDILKLGGLTLAYAACGDISNAEKGIEKLEVFLQTDLMERALDLLVLVQAMLGRKDEALKLIENGFKNRVPMMVYLNNEPILKSLFSESKFQEIIRQVIGEGATFDVEDRKYKQSLFSNEHLEKYKKQLEQLMIKEKPYLEPSFSLRDLAKSLDISPNKMSQLLNEGFDKNFVEFVNSYRL